MIAAVLARGSLARFARGLSARFARGLAAHRIAAVLALSVGCPCTTLAAVLAPHIRFGATAQKLALPL